MADFGIPETYAAALPAYTEYSAVVAAGELHNARVTEDFGAMVGALGLAGEFVPRTDDVEAPVTISADHDFWTGDLITGRESVRMHLAAHAPGRIATWWANRRGTEPCGELNARVFWDERQPHQAA
jgi:hypothetical protein